MKIWPKNFIQKADIKKGFKEAFIMVASILIALAINDWNDERKERITEIKILKELRSSLQADLTDLEGNANRVASFQHHTQCITDFISLKRPFEDSLTHKLNIICHNYSFFISNRASFESLKAKGLDIISNDSLRLGIITLYEYTYKLIERSEARRIDEISSKLNYFGPQLQIINDPSTKQETKRLFFEQIIHDQDFNRFLFSKISHDKRVSETHSKVACEVSALTKALEIEINQLQHKFW